MVPREVALLRLLSQRLVSSNLSDPAGAVRHLGAIQAQDYSSALWAIGCRVRGSTEATIEAAIAAREIVRTWPMRGTLHLVPAPDVSWMLALLTPRIIAGSAGRFPQLELDDVTFRKARRVIEDALHGGAILTRDEVFRKLEESGISPAGQRGYHILCRFAQEGVICQAFRIGRQPTYALLEEWIGQRLSLDRERALAELARRYFTGHGPATLKDFVWWSGLKITDARAGLANAASALIRETVAGAEYWLADDCGKIEAARRFIGLLPGFDELLLGYTDRSASLPGEHAPRITPGNNGIFMPTMVRAGKVMGTWRKEIKRDRVEVVLQPFEATGGGLPRGFAAVASRYGVFLGRSAELMTATGAKSASR